MYVICSSLLLISLRYYSWLRPKVVWVEMYKQKVGHFFGVLLIRTYLHIFAEMPRLKNKMGYSVKENGLWTSSEWNAVLHRFSKLLKDVWKWIAKNRSLSLVVTPKWIPSELVLQLIKCWSMKTQICHIWEIWQILWFDHAKKCLISVNYARLERYVPATLRTAHRK